MVPGVADLAHEQLRRLLLLAVTAHLAYLAVGAPPRAAEPIRGAGVGRDARVHAVRVVRLTAVHAQQDRARVAAAATAAAQIRPCKLRSLGQRHRDRKQRHALRNCGTAAAQAQTHTKNRVRTGPPRREQGKTRRVEAGGSGWKRVAAGNALSAAVLARRCSVYSLGGGLGLGCSSTIVS